MAALIFSRLASRVKKIADGRTAQRDGCTQDCLQRFSQFA